MFYRLFFPPKHFFMIENFIAFSSYSPDNSPRAPLKRYCSVNTLNFSNCVANSQFGEERKWIFHMKFSVHFHWGMCKIFQTHKSHYKIILFSLRARERRKSNESDQSRQNKVEGNSIESQDVWKQRKKKRFIDFNFTGVRGWIRKLFFCIQFHVCSVMLRSPSSWYLKGN